MYFKDLSEYKYSTVDEPPRLLNIAWLDAEHEYNKGKVPHLVLEKLLDKCLRNTVGQTRGYHRCPFCKNPGFGIKIEHQGNLLTLGSAEIRVQGVGLTRYAAPDLIYHYIKEHNYLPQQEFIDAVINKSEISEAHKQVNDRIEKDIGY